MSQAESEAVVRRLLAFLQRDRRIRISIAVALVGALLFLGVRSVESLVPRSYVLTITGGDIVSNRHYLAKILQGEAAKHGITLIVRPVRGTLTALEQVSQGNIDLAFIQGGLETTYPHVEHVATVVPELVHLLVKPGVKGMADLRGRSVNLGAKDGSVREIGITLTRFAGYTENVDYVESNYPDEALLALPPEKMPDAILTISSVPSYLVELLVKKHQYQSVEIPFPESLALRYGWVANGQILGYTYNLNPPVPEKNIVTVAVNMHLVANAKTDPVAIEKLLSILYSPAVSARLRQELHESRINIPSGYPLSQGLTTYLDRNNSVFTLAMWNRIQSAFALAMSFGGMLIVLFRWFRGAAPAPEFHDGEFHAYLAEVANFERELSVLEVSVPMDRGRLVLIRDDLGRKRVELLERYPMFSLKDPMLFDRSIASVRAAHSRVADLLGRTA